MKSSRDAALENIVNELLRKIGGAELVGEVRVEWNSRLRTTAGMAHFAQRRITLNPKLRDLEGDEVQRTLRHELAHLLAQTRAGRRRITAHGPEWKQACRDLGIPREARCHELPFKVHRQSRRHFYQCPECGTVLARVHPVKRQVACLKCCRRFNGGNFDNRFRFVSIPEPQQLAV